MMRVVIAIAFCGLVAADIVYYDSSVDSIIADPSKLSVLTDCYLDRIPCSPTPAFYKGIIPEAFEHACRKCTPYQKHTGALIFQAIKNLLPQDFKDIRQKFDPQNKYYDAFEQELFKYFNYKP